MLLLVTSLDRLRDTLKEGLLAALTIKWDQVLQSMVGIQIWKTTNGYCLQQPSLIRRLLEMDGSVITLAVPLLDSSLESNVSVSPDVRYLSYIGLLLYVAQGTHPDIAYATHYLAQFLLNPDESHWAALRRLVAYVQTTDHFELKVEPEDSTESLKTYVDASWMGEGARSHHGYLTTLWSVRLAWNAKRQTVVAKSTCQAEYVALSMASDEAQWMAEILEPLIGQLKPVLMCDNKAAVKIAKNKASMKKTKNINREFHTTNKHLRKGVIDLKWVPGTKQMADCFTKALGANLVRRFDGVVFGDDKWSSE
jgi:hypothetical protein